MLVTHQLQYLHDCDRVVVMDGGRIVHVGTFQELQAAGVDFTGFVSGGPEPVAAGSVGGSSDTITSQSTPADGSGIVQQVTAVPEDKRVLLSDAATIATDALVPAAVVSSPVVVPPVKYKRQPHADLARAGKLITNEYRVFGSVSKSTLMTYLHVRNVVTAMGGCIAVIV